MKKRVLSILSIAVLVFASLLAFVGCSAKDTDVKIGVSFGVGNASRWVSEKKYMEERAKEVGAEIEARLNTTDKPKTQIEDCRELIDSGIDVLILTPRDVSNVKEILEYAAEKKVKVVNYARVALGEKVELFVGYDSDSIGKNMGQYLTETVYKGDYIILRGDPADGNATLLYQGAMRAINQIKDNINIILDSHVAGWSADEAKKLVKDAVSKNGNKVDAILAPNDKLAGAAREALKELGVNQNVAITGMDAEIDAVKRIVAGEQDMTVYMDLKELATMAIDEACNMAKGQKINVNVNFDNGVEGGVPANLISGKLVTVKNIDKILIDSGYFTKEEVYGSQQ